MNYSLYCSVQTNVNCKKYCNACFKAICCPLMASTFDLQYPFSITRVLKTQITTQCSSDPYDRKKKEDCADEKYQFLRGQEYQIMLKELILHEHPMVVKKKQHIS